MNGKAGFSVTLNQGGNQIIRAINDSRSSIRTSLDALLEVLVGGLHMKFHWIQLALRPANRSR
ncbi:MAG: hypothetical protein R3C26_21185 [Calditrichia bacterium]